MGPEEITYTTKLDEIYTNELKEIKTKKDLLVFIKKYKYWVDNEIEQIVKRYSWKKMQVLMKQCRQSGFHEITKDHIEVSYLLVPSKIFAVTLIATRFKVPWGCAYIRLAEMRSGKE